MPNIISIRLPGFRWNRWASFCRNDWGEVSCVAVGRTEDRSRERTLRLADSELEGL